jgi:uncharacterized protein (DUF1015 family)
MNIKPFKASYPDFDLADMPDAFCDKAKFLFSEYSAHGWYLQWPLDAFYVYQIETPLRRHTGLVAKNALSDFLNGRIRMHEKTLHDREQHQIQLFLEWEAILKPVLLTYAPVPAIQQWMEAFTQSRQSFLTASFDQEGVVHRIWAVDHANDIRDIQLLFAAGLQEAYVADGHHRVQSMAVMRETLSGKYPEYDLDNLFCAFFSSDQLGILDFNRVVSGIDEGFLRALSMYFNIHTLDVPRKPVRKHELVLFTGRKWYTLVWKPEIINKYPTGEVLLDVSLFNENVLGHVLGINNVRSDTRITYIEGRKGVDGLTESVKDDFAKAGFMLFPVQFDEMKKLADRGESMPPKSTYFEPRLKTGLLVEKLSG